MDCNYTVNKIIFDYFSFTVKDFEPEQAISLLGFEGIQFENVHGLHGYKCRYMYDGVSIHYNSARGDCWVEMTGQGCRVFESFGSGDWFGLSYYVLSNPAAQMTRVDVAYDDFNGYLNLVAIVADVRSKSWVSRARSITIHDDYDHSGLIGSSIMVGDRGSNISCRIYDKAAERNRSDEIDHWVRCELQIRHKHADNFLYYLLADDTKSIYGQNIDVENRLDALYFAVLTHFLRFIDLNADNDSNLWRKPLAAHWEKFISSYHGNGVSLYSAPGVEYNALRLRYVCEQQFGAPIFTYIKLFGSDELEQFVQPKEIKLNPKYRYLLDRRREEQEKIIRESYHDLLA